MTATPKRNARKRAQPNPLTAQDALQILYSAVCYVMQAGLRVHAGNVDGKLVLTVTGAQVIYGDGTARFDVTQAAEVMPPSPRESAEAERVTSSAPEVTASVTGKRAILYARSATDGAGIDRQLETCRAWADANGYTVTAEYSEVASGRAANLPEQAQAITRAESDGTALICVDPMRLTRYADWLGWLVADCARRRVAVHFVER